MENQYVDIILLKDSGFLKNSLYELSNTNDLVEARPTMRESFNEMMDLGIQFCYIANDEIKERFSEKVKRISIN